MLTYYSSHVLNNVKKQVVPQGWGEASQEKKSAGCVGKSSIDVSICGRSHILQSDVVLLCNFTYLLMVQRNNN